MRGTAAEAAAFEVFYVKTACGGGGETRGGYSRSRPERGSAPSESTNVCSAVMVLPEVEFKNR